LPIAGDFEIIRATGFNTVLIYEPPGEVLELAERYGLKVAVTCSLNWWAVGGMDQAGITAKVLERVEAVRSKRALLAWLLGNEVVDDILQSRGDAPMVAGLRELYAAVKQADPPHPVSPNWPPARHLDLRFLDFVSINVYPLWPPEVVAMGVRPLHRNRVAPNRW